MRTTPQHWTADERDGDYLGLAVNRISSRNARTDPAAFCI
jgi:hypothetical protein